ASSLQTEKEWVAGEVDKLEGRLRRMERWALFRSGQFVHNRAFDEIQELRDRTHVLEILDTLTGAFELASRLAKRGVLCPEAQLKFDLVGVDGRVLTWPGKGGMENLERDYWCQSENFTVVRRGRAEDLENNGRQLAIDTSIE